MVDLNTLKGWATSLEDSNVASLWMVGAFLVGGITAFPVTVLILATAYAFDAWPAMVYSLIGCIVSAIFLYAIGRQLGRKNVVRFAGKRLNRMNRLISKHGTLAVAAVRMVDQLNAFAAEVTRVAREVGTEGKLGGQAVVPGVAGTWKDLTDSVNAMAGNLTAQVRNIAEVTIAVANGDLSKKIAETMAVGHHRRHDSRRDRHNFL